MLKSITDYLDHTVKKYGDKLAYSDENKGITFYELYTASKKIACKLMEKVKMRQPVVIYMDKSVECIEAFLGVAYAGAFYVPIDIHMPHQRVQMILDTLKASVIITRKIDEIPQEVLKNYHILYYEDLIDCVTMDEIAIKERYRKIIDTDPVYAIFTSGSTGVPKGVVVNHRSVINFTEWWCETFEFSNEEVFANQTPFYFDASVKDIFATLRCGATMYIVPKRLFSLPKKLVQYLNAHKITCIDWVPSALCMIVNFRTFEKEIPQYLKKVMFLGEVMPTKQFNMWRKYLPDVKYANLYGPTEATGDCTYYKIEREFDDSEPIPIGYACNNTEVMLLDENDVLVQETEQSGEICVRGCSLALGYYNNQSKTDEVFIRNPLQPNYYEKIYRTGDLGKYNEYGEIIFLSRKDSQIKHMGHRIELGEIENAIGSLDGIHRVCCLYENRTQRIVAVYEGNISQESIVGGIKEFLPNYMMPNVYHQLEEIPINLNGKIDRVFLKQNYIKEN